MEEGWSGSNRREFPRVKYPCLVVIRSEGDDVILSHTENISIGGVGLILKQSVKLLTPVEIELDLLDLRSHIKCNGKVVWNVQRKTDDPKKPLFYDIGVEFVDITEEDRARVDVVVSKLIKNTKDLLDF